MQIEPIKPTLKPPGTKRLKLEYDGLLSNFGFKINLRRYNLDESEHGQMQSNLPVILFNPVQHKKEPPLLAPADPTARRCRLTLSKHELNARLVAALETNV